jgi:hypothetical protein
MEACGAFYLRKKALAGIVVPRLSPSHAFKLIEIGSSEGEIVAQDLGIVRQVEMTIARHAGN